MKKLLLLLMLVANSFALTLAQDTIVLNVTNVFTNVQICTNNVAVIYAQQGCDSWFWRVDDVTHSMENPLVIESQVEHTFHVEYFGCEFSNDFYIECYEPLTIPSFTEVIWKRDGETLTINPVQFGIYGSEFHWSSGETTPTVDISTSGIYTLYVTDYCGTTPFVFIVRDNVEIYRSGVDPATNKNRVLWQTTPEQAAYISSVKVERDGMVGGTGPYLDGQFLDNIGSENAARIYRITAIASDGT